MSERAIWMSAAVCGALASAPLAIGICGIAAHRNAYICLSYVLASGVLWTTLWVAWRPLPGSTTDELGSSPEVGVEGG